MLPGVRLSRRTSANTRLAMAQPNIPTSEYIRMKRDTEWLLDADHGRSSVAPYDQHARSPVHLGPGVHKQPWRFNPTKSKTFDQIQNSKGVERAMAERLLLNEIQQRHQDALDGKPMRQQRRRRKPRTLQPMPLRQHQQLRRRPTRSRGRTRRAPRRAPSWPGPRWRRISAGASYFRAVPGGGEMWL